MRGREGLAFRKEEGQKKKSMKMTFLGVSVCLSLSM